MQAGHKMPLTPEADFTISDPDINVALGSGELNNCPFCGSWAIASGRVNRETGIVVYTVLCTGRDCAASVHANSRSEEEAREKAVARWNRRSS